MKHLNCLKPVHAFEDFIRTPSRTHHLPFYILIVVPICPKHWRNDPCSGSGFRDLGDGRKDLRALQSKDCRALGSNRGVFRADASIHDTHSRHSARWLYHAPRSVQVPFGYLINQTQRNWSNLNYIPFSLKSRARVLRGGRCATSCGVRVLPAGVALTSY